jgi:glycosyltransferase involved in cell wall biosynthesis
VSAASQSRIHQILVSAQIGGAGLIALEMGRHLLGQGRTARAWIPGRGPAWDEATRLGVPCSGYDRVGSTDSGRWRAARANLALGCSLRRAGRGLVHIHSPGMYGALRWAIRMSGSLRVVHIHIEEPDPGLRWALRSPPELILTCANFLVEPIRRCLPERFQENTRIVAVPNAVDVSRFSPGPKEEVRRRLDVPPGRPLALMLANLSPHKGQETAIRATAILKQRGVDLTCWLAGVERGASSYTDRLAALIREAGVEDRVKLLGQRGDAPDLLRAADFFLLPSTNEGLPLSILEAQASKVPVLAAPTAGVPEVVEDGKTGFLLPAHDPEAYARCLQQLLDQPEFPRRIAEQAFARTTSEHTWSAYCRRVTDLYDELLGLAPSGNNGGQQG